jgi:hypothetical protein
MVAGNRRGGIRQKLGRNPKTMLTAAFEAHSEPYNPLILI